MLSTFTLKNGLRVAGYQLPNLKSVHIVLTVKAGSCSDPAGKSGLSHFMEHLLLEGTPSWPAGDKLRNYIQSLAGNYGAQTGPTTIRFTLTLPFHYLDKAFQIGSEVFYQSLFPNKALEKERQAIVQEINQRINSSWYPKSQFFKIVRFLPDHPLIPDAGGDITAVRNLKREEIVNYYQNYFVPSNTYLGVFGNFSEKQLVKLVEKYFGQVPAGKAPPLTEMTPTGLSKWTVAIRQDQKLQSNSFDFSFPTASLSNPVPVKIAQHLANKVLGSLVTSRLMTKLRFKKGYVYGVYADSSRYPDFGYNYVSSETTTPHLDETLRIIAGEISQMKMSGLTKAELSRTKKYLIDKRLMLFDYPGEVSDWIEGELLWEDKIRLPEEYNDITDAISTEDIVNSLKKYWDFSKLNLTIQGPVENSPTNIEKYEKMIAPLKD